MVAIENLEEKVRKTLEDALELAQIGGRKAKPSLVAESVYRSDPELVEAVKQQYILDRWSRLVGVLQRNHKYAQVAHLQLVLPDPIFQDLPQTIFLRNGTRPKLDYCSLDETQEHLEVLRERFKVHPRVAQMEALVAIHRKWAKKDTKLTWGEAKRREAADRAGRELL